MNRFLFMLTLCFMSLGKSYITANSLPRFEVTCDFIYWRPCAESELFLFSKIESADVISAEGILVILDDKRKDHFFEGDFEPDFRLGLYCPSQCGWGLKLGYLRMVFDKREKIDTQGFLTVITDGLFIEGINPLFEVIGKMPTTWKMHLNSIGAGIHCSDVNFCGVRLSPKALLRYVSINSRFTEKQRGKILDLQTSSLITNFEAKLSKMDNFQGVGPDLGLLATYEMGCGLELYLESSVALLFGKKAYKVIDFTDRFDSPDPVFDSVFLRSNRIVEAIHCNQTELGLNLGAKWSLPEICGISSQIGIGWEHQIYFHYFRNNNNFSFQGLTLSGRIGF